MKITSIKQQVKQTNRYSVFIDGKYSFSLSETALLNSKISSGLEVTAAELDTLKKMSAQDKSYGRALNYAAIRPRSEWEVRFYLKRKDVADDEASAIIEKLQNIGLLDELAFARSWVASRRLLKATSKRRLIQELHQKHVPDSIITQVLEEDEGDEREILRDLVARKRQQARYKNDDLKLKQYLARQGYSYDDITSVMHDNVENDE